MSNLIEKEKEVVPQIKVVKNVTLAVDKTPLTGNIIYVHGIPDKDLEVISKILDKPIMNNPPTVFVACAKARDGTKLYLCKK